MYQTLIKLHTNLGTYTSGTDNWIEGVGLLGYSNLDIGEYVL